MQQYAQPLRKLRVSLLALSSLAVASGPALAQTVTFATFNQQADGKPFTFNNAGPASTFTVNPTPLPVDFKFFLPNPAGTGFINANLTLSALVDGPAIVSGSSVRQNLDFLSLAFRRTSDNANLLTVTGTGFIEGINGAFSASFRGDTQGTTFNTVNFTSDFLDFSTSSERNFAINMTSVTPMISVNANGYLNSYTSSGGGTFASNFTPIPEPSAVVGMTLLGGGMAGLMVRARRRKSAAG